MQTTTSFTPLEFLCPMTKRVMRDPLMSRHGYSFERSTILGWLAEGHGTCPVSGNPLRPSNLVSNKCLQSRIQKWATSNGHHFPAFDDSSALVASDPKDGEENTTSGLVGKCLFVGFRSKAPKELMCPLTMEVMTDPMMTKDGVNFERSAILKWLENNDTCPVTGKLLTPCKLVKNWNLQKKITKWQQVSNDMSTEDDAYFMRLAPSSATKKQNTLASLAA